MEKIKERAERYARKVTGWLPLEDERSKIAIKHYTAGATEQKAIDDAEFGCKVESYETGFVQGQEVGEREMADKACKWLTEHTFGGEYDCLSDTTSTTILYHGQRLLSTEFRKAMGLNSENYEK